MQFANRFHFLHLCYVCMYYQLRDVLIEDFVVKNIHLSRCISYFIHILFTDHWKRTRHKPHSNYINPLNDDSRNVSNKTESCYCADERFSEEEEDGD